MPRSYHEPCACGRCPKLRADRPPTKVECVEWWRHQYGARWPEEKILRYAIGTFTHFYAMWVNKKGWRKPADWSGGRVPLAQLSPKGRRFFPRDVMRWEHELTTEMERRLRARTAES